MPETFAILALDAIRHSITNPRKTFDEAKLKELAESIRARGIIQPLLVRPAGAEDYELICGERRLRAAELAGLKDAPCMVRELDDVDVLEIQIIENDQREDVLPLEQAEGYKTLLEAGQSIDTIAAKIGRTRRYVTGRLALNALDELGRQLLSEGRLTLGGAIKIAKSGLQAEFWKYQEWTIKQNGHIADASVDGFLGGRFPLLRKSKFPIDDPNILPSAGSCLTCVFNNCCNPDLFGEGGDPASGRCTKPACRKEKLDLWVFNQLRLVPHLRALTKEGDADHGWNIVTAGKDADSEEFPLVGIYTTDDWRKGDVIRFREKEVKNPIERSTADIHAEIKAERRAAEQARERRADARKEIFRMIRAKATPELDRTIIEAFVALYCRAVGAVEELTEDMDWSIEEEDERIPATILFDKIEGVSMAEIAKMALHVIEYECAGEVMLGPITERLAATVGVDAQAIWDKAQ